MKKITLTFGLISGGIVTASMLLHMAAMDMENPNFDSAEWLGYLSMIVAFSTIFFGIRAYRDKHLNGHITFGKAFKVGSYISLIASVLYVVSWISYVKLSGTNFMDQYFDYSIQLIKESGDQQALIDEKVAELTKSKAFFKSTLVQIGVTFLEILPVGLLMSLIGAWVFKRKSENTTV
jgi:hypothetical protein